MKFIKYVIISCFFFTACTFLRESTCSKEKMQEVSMQLNFVEVNLSNPNIFPILDTVIFYSHKYNCSDLDNSYFVIKFLNINDSVYVRIFQKNYTEENYMLSRLREEVPIYGFYYKSRFFWVDYGIETGCGYDLVRKSNKEFSIDYNYKKRKKGKRYMIYNELGSEYLYIDNKFVIKNLWKCK